MNGELLVRRQGKAEPAFFDEQGHWSAQDAELAELLNSHYAPYQGPSSGVDPLAVAFFDASKALNAEIIRDVKPRILPVGAKS